MIEALLDDKVEMVDSPTSQKLFDDSIDFDGAHASYLSGVKEWKTLPSEARAKHNGKIEHFLDCTQRPDPSRDELLKGGRRFSILKREIDLQINRDQSFGLLAIEQFDADNSLLQLLEHLENANQIRDVYRLRKLSVGKEKNSGITEQQARILKSCMRQGRDLFQSGQSGSLMIKPLVWFYSLTAYAYACILLNHVSRYSIDTFANSHGLNYQPDEIRTQFGGSVKHGTFSDLFFAFSTFVHKSIGVDFAQSNVSSLLAFQEKKITTACGTLLSLLPEMREYYSLLTDRPSRVHPLDIVQVSEGRGTKWEFQIGDGQAQPDLTIVDQCFLQNQRSIRQGKVIITIAPADLYKITALIYTDASGRFWYVDNPFYPILLPEICVHFLLSNAFSNIMRYRPGDWGEVLLNEVASDLFLLIRKYFSLFETKIPLLLLRSLSKFNPYVETAR